MSEKELTPEQRLNELIEQERVIIKKMNTAIRAGANPMVLSQFEFMLQECKFNQQELRIIQSSSGNSDFDNFLSIG
jgi:hydroxyacyl-ACP dehydratase HTD2-like protein with hotdog domain